jgi:hypothetical protein
MMIGQSSLDRKVLNSKEKKATSCIRVDAMQLYTFLSLLSDSNRIGCTFDMCAFSLTF